MVTIKIYQNLIYLNQISKSQLNMYTIKRARVSWEALTCVMYENTALHKLSQISTSNLDISFLKH